MRIPEQNVVEAGFDPQKRVEEQKSSLRFSEVMKQNRDREDAKDRSTEKNSKTGDTKLERSDLQQDHSPFADGGAAISQAGDMSDSSMGRQFTTADTVKSAEPGAAAADIQALAAEVGAHIDLHGQSGTTQTLNMTFDSKTLQGLQVQIRRQDGEVAIHFIAQSDSVASLLKNHVSELRDTLTSKGVKVGLIAVANPSAHSRVQGNRNA